jgi:SPP1 family predicted phage head-tail adaptor
MSAGKLRRRMTVEGRQRVADGAGGYTVDWVPYGDRWVHYEPMGRADRLKAMAESLEVHGTARLRYEPGLPRPIRLVDGDMVLEQVGGRAKPDDRRRWYEVDVRETQTDIEVEAES